MSKHKYRLEPNVSFAPDEKWIVFRLNMFGPTYVFAVEVVKASGSVQTDSGDPNDSHHRTHIRSGSDALAFAQLGGTGTIQGTVTDPSGAIVPGAGVSATNVATGVKTTRETSAAGVYVLHALPPGQYVVEVNAADSNLSVRKTLLWMRSAR